MELIHQELWNKLEVDIMVKLLCTLFDMLMVYEEIIDYR